MTALPLPFFEVTNWARPIVPPAPGIFVIWMREARSSCWSASDIARAVVQVEFTRKDDEALAALGEDADADAELDDETDDETDDEEED